MPQAQPDDDFETPLQLKRPFGAGIKRKRINFVPESANTEIPVPNSQDSARRSARDAYLSIVFPDATLPTTQAQALTKDTDDAPPQKIPSRRSIDSLPLCPICQLPKATDGEVIDAPHEASIAHQICLEQLHPPSALDRRRRGLAYLESYGWDPDSHKGLGASEDGRLYPVRAKKKEDNLGIGAAEEPLKVLPSKPKPATKKQRKRLEEESKMKAAKMKDLFYARDDVNKYLGVEL